MAKAGSFGYKVGWSRARCCRPRCLVERWEDRDKDAKGEGTYISTNDGQCYSNRRDGELSLPPPISGGEGIEAESR